MNLKKKSFNYQDIFAIKCNGYNKGTFVDLGCSVPDNISNVALLLDLGWSGVGFDMDSRVPDIWGDYLFMKAYNVDVMQSMSYINAIISKISSDIDYLNLDLDGYASQYAIEKLDFKSKRYKCMTVEHDEYRFGNVYKDAQRKVLLDAGYEIVVETLAEDWYVDPLLIDPKFYVRLKQLPKDYVLDMNNMHILVSALELE